MKVFYGKWYVNVVLKETGNLDDLEFRIYAGKSVVKDYYLFPAIKYYRHHIPVMGGYEHEWIGKGFFIHLLGEYYIDLGIIIRRIPIKTELKNGKQVQDRSGRSA